MPVRNQAITEFQLERKIEEKLREFKQRIRAEILWEDHQLEIENLAEKIAVQKAVYYERRIRDLETEIEELTFQIEFISPKSAGPVETTVVRAD